MCMMDRELIEAKARKRICYYCAGEKYLRNEIELKGIRRRCSYCHQTAKSYSVFDMAERIDFAFEQHYVLTSDQPSDEEYFRMVDRESYYCWDRDGESVIDVIVNSADISEACAADIQKFFEYKYYDHDAKKEGRETRFIDSSYYTRKDISYNAWLKEWRIFEKSIKTEARFFNNN